MPRTMTMLPTAYDADEKRSHEVRVGMGLYWAQTWPDRDGFAWSADQGRVSGWVGGSRIDAIFAARNALREITS